jgi:small subunit ribosomal protein S20
MANHFSALKRARQTVKRTSTNRSNTSQFRSALRKYRQALESGDAAQAKSLFSVTVSMIDKAVKKGLIHKNAAARYKSRLNARIVAAAPKTAAKPATK